MIMVFFVVSFFFPVNIEVSDFCGTDCELYADGSRQVSLIFIYYMLQVSSGLSRRRLGLIQNLTWERRPHSRRY